MFKPLIIANVLFVILVFIGCSKTDTNSRTAPNVNVISIEEAKDWYAKQSNVVLDSNVNGYLGKPDWGKTMQVMISKRESVLKVVLENSGIDHTTYRDLIFTRDNLGVLRSQVFEVLLHPGYLVEKQKGKGPGMNIRYYTEDADFTGLLVLYNIDGTLVKGRKYESGLLKSELMFEASTLKANRQTALLRSGSEVQKACKKDEDCDGSSTCVLGLCIWVMHLPEVKVVAEAPQPTTSVYDWTVPISIAPAPYIGIPGPGSSGGGTSGSGPGSLPIGWPGPGKPSSISINIDSVGSPCLTDAIKLALNAGLTNKITQTFNDLFERSNFYDVQFYEGILGVGIDADTRTRKTNNNTRIEITLNSATLPNSSKEYIVATVLHEAIHAMYDRNGVSQGATKLSFSDYVQHNLMADKYVVLLSIALREIFPSLNDFDAKALAWGGLQDGVSWKALNPSVANKLLLGSEEYDAKHTKGIRCTFTGKGIP